MKSASFYRKKLEDLDIFQTSLTPVQYLLYKPRIEDIRKNIQQQVKLTDTYTPFIKSFEPYILPPTGEDEKKKTKKDHAKEFFNTYNYAYMQYHGPNTKSLDQETLNKAKMVKAGEFYNEDGHNKANMYLEQKDIPFYIDDELSDDVGLVLVRKARSDTGQTIERSSAFPQEVKIAYRGTQPTNPRDWRLNYKILTRDVHSTNQYKQARNQLREVVNKYGDPSELLSFSRGSSIAVNLGEEFGYKTTNFNPFFGTGISNLKSGKHRVIRSEGDPFSFGLAAMAQNENFKVETLPPYDNALNPLTIHSIDNMILNKPRQSEVERQAKILNIRKTARKLSDAESLVKINNFRKNRLYDRREFAEINHHKESISFNHVKQKVKDIVKSGVSKMKKIKLVGQALRNRFDSPAQSISEEQPLLGDDFENVSLEMDELNRVPVQSTESYFDMISGGAPPPSEDTVFMGGGEGPIAVPLVEGAPPPTKLFDRVENDAPSLDLTDLERRMNELTILPPQQSIDVEMSRIDEANANLPSQFNEFFTNRRGDKSFTDYIHSLDAGGTILEDGNIKLAGDGFKNQRALWELSGGDFTSDEQEHFEQFPRESDFETELSPAEISTLNNGSIDVHNKFIDDLSLQNQDAFMELHSSNQVPTINEVGYGSRIRSGGTNLATGFLAQKGVDYTLDTWVDPDHKVQEDARQGISGFFGGGLGEAGALRLAGTAVTAEAVLPVAVGAGAGAVTAYETDKWFQNNAPKEVYLRDISDNMVGMGVAGAVTGTMLGGPMGGLIGGGIGLATGFLFGTGEYLYQKYL